jgi:hypothetical protein
VTVDLKLLRDEWRISGALDNEAIELFDYCEEPEAKYAKLVNRHIEESIALINRCAKAEALNERRFERIREFETKLTPLAGEWDTAQLPHKLVDAIVGYIQDLKNQLLHARAGS